jgi:hypothetical protein
MREVVLIFPDDEAIFKFISENNVNGVEVKNKEQSLSSVLEEDIIQIAIKEYSAHLIKKEFA